MRIRARAVLPVAAALVVVVAVTAAPAVAGQSGSARATAPAGVSWSPALASGDATGVTVRNGRARLDRARAFVAPAAGPNGSAAGSSADLAPTGLLTLPVQQLGTTTGEVDASVDAQVPAGAAASIDVRAMQASGNWSEWIPAGPDGRVVLPAAAREVQARLVLSGQQSPVVNAVTLTARPAVTNAVAANGAPLSYKIFATREGLVGATTANGHVITPYDHFVALPSRRALSAKGAGDYSVKVCAASGRCAFAPVWDVGPWNTKDDYWNPSSLRQTFQNLPQGTPEAQAAFRTGYNGGKDGYGRRVANPAGIDLADGVFWNVLGLNNNATVTVTYLWTGSVRLLKVVTLPNTPGASTGFVPVLGAPSTTAPVVGYAARNAGVPVTCRAGAYLQIGPGQFIAASAVPSAQSAPACAG